MSESRWKVGGRVVPAFSRKLLAIALGAAVGVTLFAPVQAAQTHINRILIGRDAPVQVFVRLSTPSVAELNATAMKTTGALASDAAQAAQVTAINAEQANMRSVLASHGATLLSSLRVGANGLRVSVPASEIANLRALPGVRSVGRVVRYRPTNITSVPAIGAPQVWQKYNAKGKGVSIAIIDTGIDYTHANFGGPGTPAAYAAVDPNTLTGSGFPTAKVIGGYDFAGADYNADIPAHSTPVRDPNPLDGNVYPPGDTSGHGSHVAGTAAGIGVPGSIGPGVAPEAKLYALKVFGDHGGSTELVSEAIEWALDPNGDGNMKDHVDVINMSLGSDFGDPNDPSAISAENAADLGVIVVAASGNAGNVPYITGSPAIAPSVISTAAVTPAGRIYSTVKVNAPANIAGLKNNLEGSGPVTVASVAPLTANVVRATNALNGQAGNASDDGCLPLANAGAVSGKFVLMVRGACTFVVKAQTALNAGAIGLIVRNHGRAPDGVDPIVMGLDDTSKLPAVMIGYADGVAVAGAATTTASSPVSVTLDMGPDPTKDDQIATFSSRGPGTGSTFKPDLSAPGVSIVSTAVATGTGAKNLQGTSMATPHVAGAAALLHQLHPELKPWEIKALLQNSTVDANPSGDTALARQGVGSIRVSNAADLTSFATPGGVSFGHFNPIVPDSDTRQVTLKNLADRNRTFKVTHVPHSTYAGVTITCPTSVSVKDGSYKDFQIRFAFNPIASGKAGAGDEPFKTQTEVDGWCVLDDGTDQLRVGYLAVVDPASQTRLVSTQGGKAVRLVNAGPAVSFAEPFTFVKNGGARYGRNDDKPDFTIDDVGFRQAPAEVYPADYDVAEIGISVKQPFENLSTLEFEMDIDTNGDGNPDVALLARDYSRFDPNQDAGTFVTAQYDVATDGLYLDWEARAWDYNDRVLSLPFTKTTGNFPLFFPATGKFAYTLYVTNTANGSTDVQTGTINWGNELKPDLADFFLDPKDSADITVSGKPGKMMWLLPNNVVSDQSLTIPVTPPKK